jgi:hypothetical protein
MQKQKNLLKNQEILLHHVPSDVKVKVRMIFRLNPFSAEVGVLKFSKNRFVLNRLDLNLLEKIKKNKEIQKFSVFSFLNDIYSETLVVKKFQFSIKKKCKFSKSKNKITN